MTWISSCTPICTTTTVRRRNDALCSNAQVYVQAQELAFIEEPHPVDHRYYPDVLDDMDVRTVSGDTTIVDSIDVILTPGHTSGGQSVVVATTAGKAVITGLCCNAENFPSGGGVVPPGVHLNLIDAYESMKRVREIADILIPIHDVEVGRKKRIPVLP